ncbi:unnamed protein product [Timema podura]|uniref:Uncharacterized protein n=1 Tax=Timema podura TaxID=61482 RepID=A0ABN7NFM8_TIMPD|nr:unnamed protein product [Timema podura]
MAENESQCSSRRNDNTKTIASQTPQPTPREQHMAGSLPYPWLSRPRKDCIGIVRDYSDRLHLITNLDSASPIQLKLSDKENKKEVIFKAKDLYREHFPKECTAVGNIKIDKSKIPELASANTIYFVNDIIGAREIELCIKVGQNSQEYLFTSQPLVFGYEKYLLNKDACIIRKGLGKLHLKEVYPQLCETRLKNHFRENHPITVNRDSKLDLAVIGSLVYCKNDDLDCVVTKMTNAVSSKRTSWTAVK